MARSPFTLAASVTSALPRVGVVGVGALTEGLAGRYDSAVAELDDGRRVVVRVPADVGVLPELAAEVRALRALTPGVRGLLPFRAPEVLGEAGLGDTRAVVLDFLPGYRVDPAHLPAGRGAATSVGAALAALHSLPLSIVRTEGLPVRTPQQVRTDASRLLDRATATKRVPVALAGRWRRALETDELWRFESAVVLGGAGAASFLFEDVDGAPVVTGLLDWHGLSVGDPATDLQWLASAPAAADDVYAAYVAASGRAPDGRARERARLYAELEFASWLVHGHETGRADVVDDAVSLLETLSAGVADEDLVADAPLDVDDALALLDRTPDASAGAVDTSMQTDAYDPEEVSQWMASADEDEPDGADGADRADAATQDTAAIDVVDFETSPIDLADVRAAKEAERAEGAAPSGTGMFSDGGMHDGDAVAEAERASEAALRRWLAE